MVQFLEELQGTATPALSPEEHLELEQLRVKYEKLKKAQGPMAAASSATSKPAKKKKDSDSSSDSEVSRPPDAKEIMRLAGKFAHFRASLWI